MFMDILKKNGNEKLRIFFCFININRLCCIVVLNYITGLGVIMSLCHYNYIFFG